MTQSAIIVVIIFEIVGVIFAQMVGHFGIRATPELTLGAARVRPSVLLVHVELLVVHIQVLILL